MATLQELDEIDELESNPDDIPISMLSPSVKLIVQSPDSDERLAFGPGVAELCIGIKKYGSLKQAAKQMDMHYSKAWKIIGEAEDALHITLVIKKPPKGYKLTKVGEELLRGYLEVAEDVKNYAKFRFQQIFPKEE